MRVTISIHLLIQERSYEKGANKLDQKLTTRERTMTKWQQEWDLETMVKKNRSPI